MTLVIPGVRSAGKSTGDQKRVATPADAIASGADYLVIGRQVTRAEDPRGELLKILDEAVGQARFRPPVTEKLLNDHYHSPGMRRLRQAPRSGAAS